MNIFQKRALAKFIYIPNFSLRKIVSENAQEELFDDYSIKLTRKSDKSADTWRVLFAMWNSRWDNLATAEIRTKVTFRVIRIARAQRVLILILFNFYNLLTAAVWRHQVRNSSTSGVRDSIYSLSH